MHISLITLYLFIFLTVVHATKNYTLVLKSKNWTAAETYCKEHFTNLAIIHTEDEWEAANRARQNNDVWIGLRKHIPVTTDNWVWADGENFMYFNWALDHDTIPTQSGCRCAISAASSWRPLSECKKDKKEFVCQYGKNLPNKSHKLPYSHLFCLVR